MRHPLATLCVILALSSPASAQFQGYFDVRHVQLADLREPDWGRRIDGDRVLFLCVNPERCRSPTGIEVKGVLRAETLPEGFQAGQLSPAALRAAGERNAAGRGSRFISAEPLAVGRERGVAMEASAEVGQTVYFVTRWLGRGNRLLDVKVTSPDRELARSLAGRAVEQLVPQVFGATARP